MTDATTPSTRPPGHSADWVGLLLLVPPPLFWAGNFLVGRMLRDDVPPFTMLFWRWVIAFTLLLPFALPAMRRDLPLYRRHAGRLLGVSATGIVAFNSFIYLGLQTTTASNALLLNSLIPILILVIGFACFGQRLGPAQIGGVALSFVGVIFILSRGDPDRLASLSFSTGDLIVFCGMISWALYTLWLRGFPAEINRIGLLGCQILTGTLMLVPMVAAEYLSGRHANWTPTALQGLAFLGVFPSVAAYLLYNLAVARLGAARAGLSIHLIPVFGVVLAVAFLGEQVHGYHLIGIAAIASGIALATRRGRG